jgi:hypothetical protein
MALATSPCAAALASDIRTLLDQFHLSVNLTAITALYHRHDFIQWQIVVMITVSLKLQFICGN